MRYIVHIPECSLAYHYSQTILLSSLVTPHHHKCINQTCIIRAILRNRHTAMRLCTINNHCILNTLPHLCPSLLLVTCHMPRFYLLHILNSHVNRRCQFDQGRFPMRILRRKLYILHSLCLDAVVYSILTHNLFF